MAKYVRTFSAGDYRYSYSYSRVNKNDSAKVRAEKRNHTAAAQKQVNDRMSRIQLTGIIAENFAGSASAYFVTLTFDAEHYPHDGRRSACKAYAEKQANLYLERLRYQAKKRGSDIKRVFCVGMGELGRYHAHLCVDGIDGETIRDCWGMGNVDYHLFSGDRDWLSDRDWLTPTKVVNPVAVARYMMGNGADRAVGQHPWHASRNCKRGSFSAAELVPDSRPLDPEETAVILDKERTEGQYSAHQYIEYLVPGAAPVRNRRRSGKSNSSLTRGGVLFSSGSRRKRK